MRYIPSSMTRSYRHLLPRRLLALLIASRWFSLFWNFRKQIHVTFLLWAPLVGWDSALTTVAVLSASIAGSRSVERQASHFLDAPLRFFAIWDVLVRSSISSSTLHPSHFNLVWQWCYNNFAAVRSSEILIPFFPYIFFSSWWFSNFLNVGLYLFGAYLIPRRYVEGSLLLLLAQLATLE